MFWIFGVLFLVFAGSCFYGSWLGEKRGWALPAIIVKKAGFVAIIVGATCIALAMLAP